MSKLPDALRRTGSAASEDKITEKTKSARSATTVRTRLLGHVANSHLSKKDFIMTHDPWQEALNASGGIDGIHVKFVKGHWSFDDDPVQTGNEGVRICILMETAQHGSVLWDDRTIVDRRLQRYTDVPPSREPPKPGWAPYTQCQAVGASGNYVDQQLTFSSSSWGGRNAFYSLIARTHLRGKREFPICTLGSKPKKNDPNGNFDPTFTVVGWAPRSDFTPMLPPDDEPPLTGGAVARIASAKFGGASDTINDDAPF